MAPSGRISQSFPDSLLTDFFGRSRNEEVVEGVSDVGERKASVVDGVAEDEDIDAELVDLGLQSELVELAVRERDVCHVGGDWFLFDEAPTKLIQEACCILRDC